ncbi:hypothetical protein RM155_08220 [Pantoea agglomerans]|uniref:hypothetical protein n=1 Tax=Enterobacter agglomerans TaxID=549 RepID=UPI00289D2333|nr:hypothetical protein [Pantoea agglomerans]WNK72977.1 hypothetical protein RM155_08220 [Pantoea agglomerans]
MKERPILLNADMVRAVLDGRKTQTRRVMKVQPHAGVRNSPFVKSGIEDGHGKELVCPFGGVGDRLWVREKTRVDLLLKNRRAHVRYEADGEYRIVPVPERIKPVADGRCMSNGCYREASRITLEITGVRVERLWDITEDDAKAEGCTFEALRFKPGTREVEEMGQTAVYQFGGLWQSIYGADSWQANLWVWVIEFKRVEVE